jgi:anti-anti-sigma factor
MGVEQSSQFSNTNPAGQSSSGKKTALVEVQWSSPFLTVRPAGPQIGQRESPIITDEVMPFFRQAGKTLKVLVLDLSDVTFMSSMGLGMCIAFRNQASAVGAKSVLFGVSAELKQPGDRRNSLIEAVTLEDVNRVSKSYLDPARYSFIVVGEPQGMKAPAPAE